MADRYHVEAWSLPLATTTRTVARVPFIKGSLSVEESKPGRGSLIVREDWDRLDDVSDPATGTGSFFRVFQNNVLIPEASFFGRRDTRGLVELAAGQVALTGPGVGDVMNYARVENFDYPRLPTVDPDWSWGAGAPINGFKNPSFEASVHSPPAPAGGDTDFGTGFENETLDGWDGQSGDETFEPVFTEPTVDNGDARTGTFSLVFTPQDLTGKPTTLSAISRKIRIAGTGPAPAPGHRYQFTIFLKTPTTGRRFIFGASDVAIAHHTNGFIDNGIGWAELDNVAEGTGSTDGTFQQFDLDVTFDSFVNFADITLYVAYTDDLAGPITRIDDYSGVGFNLGLFPWEATDFALVTLFDRDITPPTPALDGVATANITTTAANHGIGQRVEGLTIGRTYTFPINVHHDTGSAQDFIVRIVRTAGGTILNAQTVSVPTGGTFTTMSATAEVDVDDVFVQLLKVTAGTWWLDLSAFFDGQAAASWGDINLQLLNDAAVDHTGEAGDFARETLPFLDFTSFTALLDSAGNGWTPATVDYRAKRGPRYTRIEADGRRMGFEWQVVDDVATGLSLKIFNPYDWVTRTGGIGTNRIGSGVPEIRYGAGVTGGPLVRQPSTGNRVHIEGEAGLFSIARDTPSIDNYDTREVYEGSTDFLDTDTLDVVADQILADRVQPSTALKINLAPHENPDVPTPFQDFGVGDTYPIQLIGTFVGAKRCVKITADFTPGYGSYVTEWDAVTYTTDPQKAIAEAVRRLMAQIDTLEKPADLSGPATVAPVAFTGPIEATYLVASSSARDEIKAVADFVCDGVADDVEINAAWQAIENSATGVGTVVLTRGTYQLADQVVTSVFGGSMYGVDRISTKLRLAAGSVSSVLRVRQGTVVRDLGIIATGTATCTRGALELDDFGSQAIRVQVFTDTGVGIWVDSEQPRVEGCTVTTSGDGTHGIYLAPIVADGGFIVHNETIRTQEHGIMVDGSVSAGPDKLIIAGNIITRPSDGTADTFDGIHVVNPTSTARTTGLTIVGNVIDSNTVSYRDGIRLAGANVEDTMVCGNHAIGTFSGAQLTDAGTNTEVCTTVESPLTTKGDLHVYTTVDTRLAVGTDGEILAADSAEASGVKWVDRTPVADEVAAGETTASTTFADLTTAGPAVTLVTGTTARITVSANISNNTAGAFAVMGYAVSGASALAGDDAKALVYQSPGVNSEMQASWSTIRSDLTPGTNTFTAKYRATSGTLRAARRNIEVTPLPDA